MSLIFTLDFWIIMRKHWHVWYSEHMSLELLQEDWEASSGHFTHETESPWLLHFKHSHWWKRRSRSKFATSHYAWGANGVCECKMDVKSTCIPTWHWMDHVYLDYFSKLPLGGRLNTGSGDHDTPNTHNCWFIPFYHVWGPAWIYLFLGITFGWGPSHIWLHTALEDPWPHYMIFTRGVHLKLRLGMMWVRTFDPLM